MATNFYQIKKLKTIRLLAISVGLILIFMPSCKSKINNEISEFETELLALKTIQEKRDYLEMIFKDDQKLRNGEDSAIILRHGADSKEYKDYVDLRHKQDEENLDKIEAYFKLYGHPKQSEVGEIAAITPWAVIHHAQRYDARERNFTKLYKAHLNGDLDDSQVSMLLHRMYQMKIGKRFSSATPYNSEDEINRLIEILNLDTQ